MSEPAGARAPGHPGFAGNDRLLVGMILGVLTFWLFAQSTLNIAPDMQRDLGIGPGITTGAVAAAALFSGIFIVVMGGLADRFGRMRILRLGFVLGIAGSLLVGLAPAGGAGTAMLLSGRALQGLSAACIMPASLALREAGMVALGFNLLMVVVAIASIVLTIPPGKSARDRPAQPGPTGPALSS